MTKRNYDEMSCWQRVEARETERKRTDRRLNYLLYAGFTAMIIVALCELF